MSCRCAQLGLLFLMISAVLALSTLAVAAPIEGELTPPPRTAAAPPKQSRPSLLIHAVAGGWGHARTKDIETVLYSVASVLLDHFPGRHLDPIVVSHSNTAPMTLFARGPNNEYRVHLSASDRYWARYAYEFAHELSHILTNYEHHAYSAGTTHNQWFEEALCEVASLYALRQLSVTWKLSPPYPHWAAYAPMFARFAQHHLNESHRRLPSELSLAAWFERYERDLARTPYLRAHNELVASVLLPLFEENPRNWEAVGYLNLHARGGNFRDYLHAWHASAPEKYKGVIKYIAALFGFERSDRASQAAISRPTDRALFLTPYQPETPRPGPASPAAG